MTLEKKMKRKISLIVLLGIILPAISIIFMKISSSPDRIIKDFRNVKSYECDVTYTFINSMGKREEKAKQYFLREKGNRVVFGDNRIQVYNNEGQMVVGNGKHGIEYSASKENYNFYEVTFINYIARYLNDADAISFEYDKKAEERCYKVTIPLEGNNPNFDKGIFYINIPCKVPEKLVIFNKKGDVTFEAIYSNFKINPGLEESLFQFQSN